MLDRFPRRIDAAVFVVAALVSALIATATVSGAVSRVGETFPGFVTWDNLVVVALGRPSWTGRRADVPFRSHVDRIDGEPVTRGTELGRRVDAAPPGTPHRYVFGGRGGGTERTVESMRFGRTDLLTTFGPYALNGLVFCLTGLAVFFLKPDAPQSRAVLAMGVVWGLTLFIALDLFNAGRLHRLYFIIEALAPAAVLHLALRFPEPRRSPLPVSALYALGLVVGVAETWLFQRDVGRLLAVNDVVGLVLAGSAVAAVASIAAAAFSGATALARRRARVVLAGFVAAFAIPIAALVGFLLLGQRVSFSLLAVTGFVFPLSIGYAVARHDLFEADRFVKRTMVYATLTSIVSLAYGASVLLADRFTADLAIHRHPLFPVGFALVILAAITPLRDRVQHTVDRLFYRGRIDYKRTIGAATDQLATLLDREQIAEFVVRTLRETLHFEHAALIPLDGQADRATDVILALGRRISRDEAAESMRLREHRSDLLARFAALDAEMLVPLRHRGEPVGLLAVGPKGSGHPLSEDDVDVVETLANATGAALATARAVADLSDAQERLSTSERLAAIGELAAAVAHGIRNPLAGIRLAAQLGLEGTSRDESTRENLEDVLVEVDRLESQIRGVLDFAKPFQPTLGPVALDALIAEVLGGMRGLLDEAGIAAHLDLPPDLPPVLGDEAHLRQVLHELLRNALDATPGGGRLDVALGMSATPRRLRLTITDSGPGVAAEQREKIFRLFATTKTNGTGVGLAVVRKIVEAHGGAIVLETVAPAGACFAIELPVAQGATSTDTAALSPS